MGSWFSRLKFLHAVLHSNQTKPSPLLATSCLETYTMLCCVIGLSCFTLMTVIHQWYNKPFFVPFWQQRASCVSEQDPESISIKRGAPLCGTHISIILQLDMWVELKTNTYTDKMLTLWLNATHFNFFENYSITFCNKILSFAVKILRIGHFFHWSLEKCLQVRAHW